MIVNLSQNRIFLDVASSSYEPWLPPSGIIFPLPLLSDLRFGRFSLIHTLDSVLGKLTLNFWSLLVTDVALELYIRVGYSRLLVGDSASSYQFLYIVLSSIIL